MSNTTRALVLGLSTLIPTSGAVYAKDIKDQRPQPPKIIDKKLDADTVSREVIWDRRFEVVLEKVGLMIKED